MDRPVILWRYGEPMERSYAKPVKVPERVESALQHGEDSRNVNYNDTCRNREMSVTNYIEFGGIATNPFFSDTKFSDVVSKQDDFMRGRQKKI